MAVKKNEVSKIEAGAVEILPDFLKGTGGAGTENLSSSDYEMPRIKLIQGISDELQLHDGVAAGDFFHTLAEESLGNAVRVVPLYVSKRYVLWCPRPPVDKGGILARSDDAVHWEPADTEFTVKIDKAGTTVKWRTAKTVAASRLAEWGTYNPADSNSQPAATLCYVVVVALLDRPDLGPVAVMLQRSAVKPARKWLGKINMSQAAMYGQVYTMESTYEKSDSGAYNGYSFRMAGYVQDADVFASFKSYHEQFKSTGVNVKDMDSAQDEGGTTSDAGDPAEETRY